MKTVKLYMCFMLFLLIGSSCSEEILKPTNIDDNTIPAKISDVQVENLDGVVKLSYIVPKGTSILYVEAECEMEEGRVVKTKSSYYNQELIIEGFGKSKEHEVKLYSVGRNLKRSEPVIVKVNPLDAPIWHVFNTLEVNEDFGGMNVGFTNDLGANIVVRVDLKDSLDQWGTYETFYTNQKSGNLTVRGLKAVEQSFKITLSDRWDNKTEVLDKNLTPLYEAELDKGKFMEHRLPNDATPFTTNRVSFLWNNNRTSKASGEGGWYRTDNGSGIPNQLTMDLGVTAKLSRIMLWQRGSLAETNLLYSAGSPRLFEIWGSNDPNPDGSYDSWVKLLDAELIKPSGLPIPTNNAEDLEVAARGHEFVFPITNPEVRYIRIKVLRTYGVTNYFWLGELSFFGQPN